MTGLIEMKYKTDLINVWMDATPAKFIQAGVVKITAL